MPISETQIENGTFRVTRWELEPGDTIPAHVHEHEYVVVPLTEGTLWATATDGTETAVELSIGISYARPAGASRTVENRGTAWIMFVEIETLS
ncbi:cupin domain-containing protein [Arthrobacter sp. U41]|uniref:cupin domain-containing protein n=1 Tax=Arthrobacter sp. U41 TaxID=1849032 RepID=UPI0009F2A116|nr:cupin domain-containing protein [Arthrobacter sp. U41]